MPSVCGDGLKFVDIEPCEDGNSADGDGCDRNCLVEPGYFCRGGSATAPDVCTLDTCGDGVRLPSSKETCDDGNTTPGDGCSADCTVEEGYYCTAVAEEGPDSCQLNVCGDARRLYSEECDDGNLINNDGCSSACTVEENWECATRSGAPDRCLRIKCRFHFYVTRGNVGRGTFFANRRLFSLGPNKFIDPTWATTAEHPSIYNELERIGPFTILEEKILQIYIIYKSDIDFAPTSRYLITVDGKETPCRGNSFPIGRDAECDLAPYCSFCGSGVSKSLKRTAPNKTESKGVSFPGEPCDDGNNDDGDGCSSNCLVEEGFHCYQIVDFFQSASDYCERISCGDSILDPGEECEREDPEVTDVRRPDLA